MDQNSKRYHIRRRREAPAVRLCQTKQIEKNFFEFGECDNFKLGCAAPQHATSLQRYRRQGGNFPPWRSIMRRFVLGGTGWIGSARLSGAKARSGLGWRMRGYRSIGAKRIWNREYLEQRIK
jgi:hypothetical protein